MERPMKLVLLGSVLLLVSDVAHAETKQDLWRDGYKIVWESAYADVEECTPDDPVTLSSNLLFICDGYEYVYHYGGVSVASRTLTYKGKSLTISFLCLEDEDECLSGQLVRH